MVYRKDLLYPILFKVLLFQLEDTVRRLQKYYIGDGVSVGGIGFLTYVPMLIRMYK